ncbi:MAG: hypothetical protein A3J24_01145 [Deltaproteobacteria bacterium RIFCSPLOWO2_02_FULL_53_8]|nr:MAG: hypothetical protein A3J24_01145 [Deltaproteobacteria bacterium RIFCSPLOWO2_02_FULL_53_8]
MTHNNGWRTITVTTGLSWLMKLMMTGLIPYEIYKGEYLFVAGAVAAVGISLVPSIVEKNYRVTLPFELDMLITLSLFLHTFLGEGLDFYQRFAHWDKFLHLYGGLVVAVLGFVIVYTLHYTRKVRLSIPLIGLFTVIFALAVGALWEIGEFALDNAFARHTQDDLPDTMWDLIDDLIGGTIAAVLGMLYVRYTNPAGRKRLARPLGEVLGVGARIDRVRQTLTRKLPSLTEQRRNGNSVNGHKHDKEEQ